MKWGLALFGSEKRYVILCVLLIFDSQRRPLRQVLSLAWCQLGQFVVFVEELRQCDAETVAYFDEGRDGGGVGFVEHGAQCRVRNAAFFGESV